MQFLAAFIMKGRMQAIMVASAFALLSLVLPPVSIISSAAVALVTLRHGPKEGLWVLFAGSLAAAILSSVLLGSYQFALLYSVLLWLPVALIAWVLRNSRSLGIALEAAVLLASSVVLVFYALEADVAGFWLQILDVMTQSMQTANPDVAMDTVKESADLFSHYMTGGIAAGSVFGLLFGLFLARGWQANLYNPGGFISEYKLLKSHKVLAIISLFLAVVAALASGLVAEISLNLLMVLFVLYTIVGASLLHAAFCGMNSSRFMVPFLYVTLLLIPHVMALVALLGLLDAVLNLRDKFNFNGNASS